jgi:hypothetical protein
MLLMIRAVMTMMLRYLMIVIEKIEKEKIQALEMIRDR